MANPSTVIVDSGTFKASAIPQASHASNKLLATMSAGMPEWHTVGAATYREMSERGETLIPAPVYLPNAIDIAVPSRENGRTIPCRVLKPEGDASPKGIFLHFHPGGWVMMNEKSQDSTLKKFADATNLVAISVGYRLAPENPFPAGPEDCFDVAEWLIKNGNSEFGADLKFIGGESAGGHLSMLTVQHLLTHGDPTISHFPFKGLLLNYGAYDLSLPPSAINFRFEPKLIFDHESILHFVNAAIPDKSTNLKHPSISPLYFNFSSLSPDKKLPPAFFACGTQDPLLDDTLFMSVKWQTAGGETVTRIIPGAPHAYLGTPDGMYPGVPEAWVEMVDFVKARY
ncbi:hypothetical protein FQN53_005385 [Emmonsiellopsis sp. PD_33]|nr:hypothetical protein FQN53_005385 [Emmonsiellopsis sp. PD_33]